MHPPLIFDLDGTLIDSLPGIAASLNYGLEKVRKPRHPEEKVRDFIGNGSYQLALRALPTGSSEDLAHEVETQFKSHYQDHWSEGTTIYPGIEELLAKLRKDKWPLAVLSNKPDAFTRSIVAEMFAPDTFDIVVGQREKLPRKPDPAAVMPVLACWQAAPEDALFIGDSTVDRETANRSGIPFIGVAWGYHDPADLGPIVAENSTELSGILTEFAVKRS